MSRLQEIYQNELAGEIQKKLGLENPMEVPRITKITLNMGVGEAIADKKVLENARADMEKISGQRPVTRIARKSVAAFKIRDGMPIRLQGDAASRAYVRVSRSASEHRDTPYSRLPWT